MSTERLNKYRLSLPMRDGVYVAASSFEEAIRLMLPDDEIVLHSTGPKWARFTVKGRELSPTWPRPNEHDIPGTGGSVVDVEHNGTILVGARAKHSGTVRVGAHAKGGWQ